jgi:general secretion pathway protein N
MRMRILTRRVMLFAALLALALLLFLPLRLVLGWAGGPFQAREASGSVWSGALKEARIGKAALGDLSARLAFLPLLVGQARFEVERPSGAPDRFTGAFAVSARSRSAQSVTGTVPAEGAFGALPVTTLDLTDVTVRFRDDTCDFAEGLVRATLSSAPEDLPTSLTGSARCDRGALLLPLNAGAGGVELRLFGDGRWTAAVRQPTGPGVTLEGRF